MQFSSSHQNGAGNGLIRDAFIGVLSHSTRQRLSEERNNNLLAIDCV